MSSMVVSMNSTIGSSEMMKSGTGVTFTGVTSTTQEITSACRSVATPTSALSTEADTTFDNYYVMKSNIDSENSSPDDGEGTLSKQLKQLINLQLDLIEYQQVKITNKDKQIMALKSEKEQLEARICRMERRLATHKRHFDVDEHQGTKAKISVKANDKSGATSQRSNGSTAPTVTAKTGAKTPKSEDCPAPSALPVTVTSRNDKDLKIRANLRTNLSFLDISNSKLIPNRKNSSDSIPVANKSESVSVPSWKVIEKRPYPGTTFKDAPVEDVTNDAFNKRHLKPELEEKRRKRWDLQHLRHQQHQEHMSEQEKNKTRRGKSVPEEQMFTSLYPDVDNIVAIEINESVPVCIFGYPAPAISVKEMELPWFSIAKREVQVRQAKEKLLKKALIKTSCGRKRHSKYKSTY